MTPESRYQQDLQQGKIEPQAAQAQVITILQKVYENYLNINQKNFIQQLKMLFDLDRKPFQGLYLYGGVGCGKTYLMDIFYYSLPGEKKTRIHFHRFMRETQHRLKALQGEYDPLDIVAKEIAQANHVICFDEFFVSEIGDAMILATLFKALFKRGVALVATSNIPPEKLYYNGLQREQFLPVIDLIRRYTTVFHLDINKDFRLRALTKAGVYFNTHDHKTTEKLEKIYQKVTIGCKNSHEPLWIEGREIPTIKYANTVAWFDFTVLCNIPRSQTDYLEIAQNFTTVFLSNVTYIDKLADNIIIYFIYLVDIFYDHHVKLIIASDVAVDALYPEDGRLAFEFRRTKSRLIEMQSEQYLALPHISGEANG